MLDAHSPGSWVTAGWTKGHQTLLFKSPSIQCNIKWSLFKLSQVALEKEATDILRSLMPEGMWFPINFFSIAHTTRSLISYATDGTWLKVGHYWQITIDEEQIYLNQCLTYLYCTKLTHLLDCKRLGHYYTL